PSSLVQQGCMELAVVTSRTPLCAVVAHSVRRRRWRKSRIAPRDAHLPQVFTVTHPFHPLHGQTFELLTYRFNWGEDRVMYVRADGGARSLPVGWTGIAPEDPFATVARGRAAFRVADLLALPPRGSPGMGVVDDAPTTWHCLSHLDNQDERHHC